MDQNFRKRQQKTLYCGELELAHNPLVLTELAVEFYQDLSPSQPDQVDLETAAKISGQETVSPASMVMSMMYARRLQRKRPERLRKLSSSDLFLISMMMASKYLYDEGVDEEVFNDEWAENAGVDEEEINNMELDFLDALEWELFIRKEDFEQAMLSIEQSIAVREGLKRGWFSYTDLCLLLEGPWSDLSLSDAALDWLKVMVLSAAVYCVAVMSCALMINAGVALSSSGTAHLSLPKLHMTPAASHCQSVSPPPSHLAMKISKVSQPGSAAFRDNKTEGGVSRSPLEQNQQLPMAEEEVITTYSSVSNNDQPLLGKGSVAEEPKPVSKNKENPLTTATAIADTISSHLMAVMSLKSHLIQFFHVVSGSVASVSENLSRATTVVVGDHGRCKTAGNTRTAGQVTKKDTGDKSSDWFHETSSSQPSTKQCLHCEKGWLVDEKMHGISFLLEFQHVCNKQCKHAELNTRWQTQDFRQHFAQSHSHTDVVRPQTSCQSIQRHTASVHRLFPDVVIGFSTSMPAYIYDT